MHAHGQIQLQTSRYNTKRDAWIVVLIGVAVLLPLITALYLLTEPGGLVGGLVVLLLTVAIWALILSFAVPVYYEITPSTLLIRSGAIRREIPLSAIQRVQSVRISPHATWSFNQVRIDYKKEGVNLHYLSSIFIAPKDKAHFMRDLAAHAGNIEIVGDRRITRHL